MDDLRGIIIHCIKVALVVLPLAVGVWLLLAERSRVQDVLRALRLGQPGVRHRLGRKLGLAGIVFGLACFLYFTRSFIFPAA